MGGMTGMNLQSGQAMDEFRKNAVKLKGMPLLQNVSMTLGATGMPQNQGAPGTQAQPAPESQTSDSGSVPTNAHDAIAKGLGGMLGGFGKKKKAQDQQASADQGSGQAASNSLMDTQIQVTSYSSDALDKSLFDVPAGYTQVQANSDDPLSMKH
jgi:hypothetical protein